MKFCIVFGLVCCALLAQTNASVYEFEPVHQRLALAAQNSAEIEQVLFDSNNFSLEKLRELLESLIGVLLPIAEEVLENASVLLEEAVAKAKEVIANAEPVLQEVIDNVIRILEVIAEEKPQAVECIKKQRPAVEALARESAAKLKACGEKAVEDGKKIKDEIQAEIDAVKASLTALKNLLSECKNKDPLVVAKCVISKAKQIRQGIAQLLDNVKTLVEATSPKVNAIVKQTLECVKPVVQKARIEGKRIVDEVKKCISGKQQTIEMVSTDSSSLEKLRELLEQLVSVALPILEELLEQADVLLKQALEKAKEIISNAEPVLQKVVDEVIRVLEGLAKEHPVAVKCAKEQRPVLEALARKSAQQLKACGEEAIDEAGKAKSDIQGEIDAIKASIGALKNLLNECKKEDPAETARCVVRKSKEVREQILELVDNAKKIVESVAPKVAVIVEHALKCTKPVHENAKAEGRKIVQDVKACIAKGY